jgi:hypothetical protein
MGWREKLLWGGVGLVVISWGLEIFNVWPLLLARLSWSNWLTVALIYPAALVSMVGAYKSAPQRANLRGQILLATVFVLISWSATFSLIGKVGR